MRLPDRVLPTTVELARSTGIRERRVCAPDESSLTLAIEAAQDCLARSRYTGADLDVLIDASITRYVDGTTHQFEPPLSLAVKESIGAHTAINFDISNACAGMLTGVFILHDMIRRGAIRRGIVVSGERISGLGSLTLGDAGAAVIVDRAPHGSKGILLAGFMARTPSGPQIEQIVERSGLTLGDIDWLIPQQTSTIEEYGNTASTTLFLALHRYLDDHALHAGEKILLLSVASGLQVGVVLFELDDLEVRHGHTH